MLRIFAGGGIAVMAAGTVARYSGMIEARRGPGIGAMAVITLLGGGYVIGIFAGGGIAIMAAGAGAQHLVMIDSYGRCPG